MSIPIKDASEIAKMRIAGKLAAEVLQMIGTEVKAGVTTDELNKICHDFMVNEQQTIPATLNYGTPPFPKSICTSTNHIICHGIPGRKKLKNGDIINIDVTVIKDSFHGDTSKMFLVGEPIIPAQKLCQITRESMLAGIKAVKSGANLAEVGVAIQQVAHSNNYSVVQEFCGHGIGIKFHEPPQVLHYDDKNTDLKLEAGMIFTIEPMINLGKRHIRILPDEWTVVTKDKSLSAQWEHTILVTETGYEVLTARDEEQDLYN